MTVTAQHLSTMGQRAAATSLPGPSDALLQRQKSILGCHVIGSGIGFLKMNEIGWEKPGIPRYKAIGTVYENLGTADPLPSLRISGI